MTATRKRLEDALAAARGAAQRAFRRVRPRPCDTTAFAPGHRPGPLVTDVFRVVETIPGWFNIDDCAHFYLILSMQRASGVSGDLFEVGSYFGRSTCLLGYCLADGERLVVCDAFEGPGDDAYGAAPTPEILRQNLRRVRPDLDGERVVVHECNSRDLELSPNARFRFAHIDGGHSYEAASSDLRLCADLMLAGGVIAVDDYAHPGWPEVSRAVDDFAASRSDYRLLADLNRHGAVGRKIYLYRQAK